ncbi:MAG: ShlB/FhaC/HecB family hemolysin secretion/activation protein [Cyanobacteria bacterium J06621_11]
MFGLLWFDAGGRSAIAQQENSPNRPSDNLSPETIPPEILEQEERLQNPPVPELPSTFPAEEQPTLELNPAEQTPEPPVLETPVPDILSPETPKTQFLVGEIELLGMTLSPAQLTITVEGVEVSISELIADIEGQIATLDELLRLRSSITEAYIAAGYITSGAFIPEQAFSEGGAVQIQIVEGGLEEIEITGLRRLRPSYVQQRIQSRTARPLNQDDIETALQVLQRDPLIDTVDAQLLAGSGPGQSILLLNLAEAPAFGAGISANNHRSPIVGSTQINPYVSYTNLLGVGDRIDLSYSLTEGLGSYNIRYEVPINAKDGSLSLSIANGSNRIVESEFRDLNIEGNSSNYSLGFRQPLIKSPNSEFALGLTFDLRRSESTIFDNAEQLSRTNVSALRFSQDWVERTPSRVLAARSQFSLGLDIFDATRSDVSPDGQFVSWQGQFQWVQQLQKNRLLITRLSSQLTPNALLSLEQFSLGGINTVRGYRETQQLTDNGLAASVEMRLPLSNRPNVLQLTPFLEGGIGWNSDETTSVEGLASLGVGLLWQINDQTKLRLDYGYPLIDTDAEGDSLQENGFSFALDWEL